MKTTRFILLFTFLFLLISCESKTKLCDTKTYNDTVEQMQLDEVIRLINSGEWVKVINYKELILNDSKKHPKNQLILSLSRAYMVIGDYESALSIAKKAVKSNKDDYMALLYLGGCYDMMELYDKAEIYYLKTLELGPKYARVNLNLASIYEKTNRTDEAVEQYLKAISLFFEHDFYQEVLDYSEAVLKLDPKNYLALFYLASYYYEKKSSDKVEEYLFASLKSNPRFPLTNQFLGFINEDKGNIDIAIEYFLTAAEYLFNDGYYEAAIPILKDIIELDPNNEIAKQYLETATKLNRKDEISTPVSETYNLV